MDSIAPIITMVSMFIGLLTLLFVAMVQGTIKDIKKDLSGMMSRSECVAHQSGQEKLRIEENRNIYHSIKGNKTSIDLCNVKLNDHLINLHN